MGPAHQQFSLRWNNYSAHITNALDDLRAEDELTDVTLCAEGDKIRAHKLLLSACSTFFRETFRENPCQHPVIILKGVSFVDLQAVVTFMYNGQVNVTQDRLSCFLQTAEMLQIKGLTDMNDNKGSPSGGDDQQQQGLHPPPIIPRHPSTNSSAAKKRLIASHNNNNSSETVQQRPPTPKRRKFIPTSAVQQQGGGDSGNNNAYNNSPAAGPSSSSTKSGGNSHINLNNHHNNNTSNNNSDSNNAGVGGGDDSEDLYPAGVLDGSGMLKYEPDELLQEGDGGLGDELLGGVGGGEEEDEFRNDCSEDGDNSMQDFTGGMEQGAIGRSGGMGGGGGLGSVEVQINEEQEEEDETDVMILEDAGYDIIAYSDSEVSQTNPPISSLTLATAATPNIFTPSFSKCSSSSLVPHPPPKSVTELLKLRSATASSYPLRSQFSATPSPIMKLLPPNMPIVSSLFCPNTAPPITTTLTSTSSSSSHINILRKKRVPDPTSEPTLLNPLDLGESSRANVKPVSPFVGDPMTDPLTGETMHPCLMCDKRYRLKSSLESHVKIHEGGSENTCPLCGQTMSRQRDLKRHIANLHRGLLMSDGSITYPPNIDSLVPRRRSRKKRRRGGGGSGEEAAASGSSDQDQGSNDHYYLDNPLFNIITEPH